MGSAAASRNPSAIEADMGNAMDFDDDHALVESDLMNADGIGTDHDEEQENDSADDTGIGKTKLEIAKPKGKAKPQAKVTKPTATRHSARAAAQDEEADDEADSSDNGAPAAASKGKGKAKASVPATIVRFAPHNLDEESGDDDDDQEEEEDDNLKIKNQAKLNFDNYADSGSPKKRGRPSKAAKATNATAIQPVKRGRPSKAAQKELVDDDHDQDQDQPVPKRGRPAKGGPRLGVMAAPLRSTPLKRKRGNATKDGEVDVPRRSSRAAAESATLQITEQSTKRPKTVAAPASTPKRKDKATETRGRKSTANKDYAVEKVVDSRVNKKKATEEYLVKWVGFPVSDNTWEPAENLTHCGQKLVQFLASKKKATKGSK
ncbi:Uu.00g033320.m01.CDS01 [Anthostomella pinea]|uniref:Uu.00g033320.m01.CDS01 n=1 Tax=Anthostomella pinea TaxID=933095 RepID=A0AAI8V8V0_9PEZI|nr:Uu.00g033320.m01.CDS01 [Anthostomella pinea]